MFTESHKQHTQDIILAGQGYTENFKPNRRQKEFLKGITTV